MRDCNQGFEVRESQGVPNSTFVMPPDAAWQNETGNIAEEALSNEVTDALFMNGGFLHGLGRMILSA